MSKLHPYLTFDGTCEEAFKFYADRLGGKIGAVMLHEGTPVAEHVPPEWARKVLHAQIEIEGVTVMASDSPPGRYEKPKGVSLCIALTDVERAETLFAALEEGGSVTMPIQQTFWAARFGMVTDKFGIPWMINCDNPA